jgi:hypothetical protein
MKDNFRFVETKQTKGLVHELDKLAELESRSLNNYIGQVLKKHVASKTKNNLGETRDHIDIQD